MESRPDLRRLVESDARDYCTETEAMDILRAFVDSVGKFKHPEEAAKLFKVSVEEGSGYSTIPKGAAIGNWLAQNKHNYFATPERKAGLVKPAEDTVLGSIGALRIPLPPRWENVIEGFHSTIEMPFTHIKILAKPVYPNLEMGSSILVPILSKTNLRVFYAFGTFREVGWQKEVASSDIKWKTLEIKLKDSAEIQNFVSRMFEEFWKFTLDPIKKHYGLLEEEQKESPEAKNK